MCRHHTESLDHVIDVYSTGRGEFLAELLTTQCATYHQLAGSSDVKVHAITGKVLTLPSKEITITEFLRKLVRESLQLQTAYTTTTQRVIDNMTMHATEGYQGAANALSAVLQSSRS